MERRRVAVVLAGVLVVGGAVAGLRLAGGTPSPDAAPTSPPPPTVVKPFSAQGVLAPTPGRPPGRPGRVTVTPGPHRLQLTWHAAPPGGQGTSGAVGYAVHWADHDLLVALPYAELDGVAATSATVVQVRSVDAYGQRSAPVTVTGRALPYPPGGADNTLVDDFTGPAAPDPRLWQLASDSGCAQDGRGTGPDSARLVILTQCGASSATLGARTPFRLRRTTDGELGRFTVDTDAPGEAGELDLDLVPGQVTMIDGSANDPITATAPGVAAADADLPPGTIRVRVAATTDSDTGVAADTVQVAAGPGTPRVRPVDLRPHAIPPPRAGMSVRWDVVLRTDGVQVLRDGTLVATGNVVPQWTVAKALIEFTGPSLGQNRDDVNMIGFGGAPTSAPPLARAPRLIGDAFPVVTPGSAATAIDSTATGPGSALLRLTLLVTPNDPDSAVTVHGVAPKFTVRLGDHTYLTTPAVPGTVLLPEVRYPLVARIPAAALHGAAAVPVGLVVDAPPDYPAQVEVASVAVDVTARPGARGSAAGTAPPVTQPPQLAELAVQVLDASGNPPPSVQPLPRGRAVLDVSMDGVATQRATGAIAGLAGFEVFVDNKKVVAVPTAVDGPGMAGDWQIAFTTGAQTAGPHSVDVRAFSTQSGVTSAETFATYQLGG